MRRFFIGALALVGALSLLFLVATALLVAAAVAGGGAKAPVPEVTVLEWEVDGALAEHAERSSLTDALGARPTTVRDVVEALEQAGRDARVKALLVRLSDSPGSVAQVQELRDAVKAFRATGKKAVVFADTFGEGGSGTAPYYFASAFDEVYVQPSGDVSLLGVSAETPFARDAFAKVGVKPRIGQRKEYKNAPNTYSEQTFTAPHREATEKYLGSLYGQVVRGVAEGRKLAEERVRALVDSGPHLGPAAKEAGLVDGLLYRDEVVAKVKADAGGGAKLLYLRRYLERAGRPHTEGPTVALVYGVGGVVRGEGEGNPVSGEGAMGGDSVAKALRDAADDADVKAILFRVDSPGGSYVASDTIRREVQRAREKGKPVIVSMGTYAASGGYFVAMDADRIVAQPGTLTGSIGVYGGKMVTEGLWGKVGVNWEAVAFGRNALMYSSDADFTPEQQARNDAFLDRVYADFTSRVAAGRKLDPARVQDVARGRVWTGEDARERGLVDVLGGYSEALRLAREAAGLPPDAAVTLEQFPREQPAAAALLALLGDEDGDSSEDPSASGGVGLAAPLRPLLTQARALHRLGVQLGLGDGHPGARVLRAPLPETRW